MMLIFRKMQCSSLAQMCAEFPEALRLIRRSVLLTSAWMYRRHHKPLHEAPWLLCTLADERATEMQKQLVCDVWDQKRPCCVRPGMARRLKQRGVTSGMLRNPNGYEHCGMLFT